MTQIIIAQILDELVEAVDTAREAAKGDQRWLNALNSGYSWLLEQDVIEFDEAAHELVFTSENGIYRANGACRNVTTGEPCKAWHNGQACRHRAASRITLRAIQLRQQRTSTIERIARAQARAMALFA